MPGLDHVPRVGLWMEQDTLGTWLRALDSCLYPRGCQVISREWSRPGALPDPLMVQGGERHSQVPQETGCSFSMLEYLFVNFSCDKSH